MDSARSVTLGELQSLQPGSEGVGMGCSAVQAKVTDAR